MYFGPAVLVTRYNRELARFEVADHDRPGGWRPAVENNELLSGAMNAISDLYAQLDSLREEVRER